MMSAGLLVRARDDTRNTFKLRRRRTSKAVAHGLFEPNTWAMYRIAAPISLNLIGVFASLAVAATALSHLHSEDELAHSYAVAAQELSAISALTDSTTEDTFPQLVKDAEGAISGEHTMWVAKCS